MTGRRGAGEGAVYQVQRTRRTSSGAVKTTKLWTATVESGRDPITGKRRRVVVRAKTNGEALARVVDARRAVDHGVSADRTIRLGDFLDSWLRSVVANRVGSDNTVAN